MGISIHIYKEGSWYFLNTKYRVASINCPCKIDTIKMYMWCTAWSTKANLAHAPLTRYIKLRVAHAPGMPGTFPRHLRVSDPDMHHGACVMHVPWCMPSSLISGFLWCRWRGKVSRHSQRTRNPQCYVFGNRSVYPKLMHIHIYIYIYICIYCTYKT